MSRLGYSKNIFYFDVCGEINTHKTLELAIRRAQELNIEKIIIASETGLSALKILEKLDKSNIKIIVVTSAAGTKIENTIIGNLKIGIPDSKIWEKLKKSGVEIIRATDPIYNIGAPLEHRGIPTIATFIRKSLQMVSSGTSVCVSAVLMATDNGALLEGEVVVAVAGSWLGLDTALVINATNSVKFLNPRSMYIREIICKPINPAYSWPINQNNWRGNLEQYKSFIEI